MIALVNQEKLSELILACMLHTKIIDISTCIATGSTIPLDVVLPAYVKAEQKELRFGRGKKEKGASDRKRYEKQNRESSRDSMIYRKL